MNDLLQRCRQFEGTWLNSNLPTFAEALPPWDIVDVPVGDGTVRVGLLGLLTSEAGIFRNDKFRGLAIDESLAAAERWAAVVREEHGAELVIALTHQSIAADTELALSGCVDLILGGHEHEVMEVRPGDGRVPIVKAGSDAVSAAVVDVRFGESAPTPTAADGAASRTSTTRRRPDARAHEIDISIHEVGRYAPHSQLEQSVGESLRTLRALEVEPICAASDVAEIAAQELSSKRTRFEQTTVGTLLATAIKEVRCRGSTPPAPKKKTMGAAPTSWCHRLPRSDRPVVKSPSRCRC